MPDKVAKCPWCGGELEEGTYHGTKAGAHFLPAGAKRPFVLTRSGIEACGAIPIPPHLILCGKQPPPSLAYACRNCKKIIISYE